MVLVNEDIVDERRESSLRQVFLLVERAGGTVARTVNILSLQSLS
jgi:hypothetical protein